jgi:alpha-L-rhamnosidase
MKILVSVFNSTVYMENYVLIALCEMGYLKEAYRRMVSRYYNLAVNDNTTLWEDFFILGTKNHAWSGAPITIAFKYFMGIDTDDAFRTFTVNPAKSLFRKMNCRFKVKDGLVEIAVEDEGNKITVKNLSDGKYVACQADER